MQEHMVVHMQRDTRLVISHILNPKPETRNPKLETRNPKPETRNPKPEMQGHMVVHMQRDIGAIDSYLTSDPTRPALPEVSAYTKETPDITPPII